MNYSLYNYYEIFRDTFYITEGIASYSEYSTTLHSVIEHVGVIHKKIVEEIKNILRKTIGLDEEDEKYIIKSLKFKLKPGVEYFEILFILSNNYLLRKKFGIDIGSIVLDSLNTIVSFYNPKSKKVFGSGILAHRVVLEGEMYFRGNDEKIPTDEEILKSFERTLLNEFDKVETMIKLFSDMKDDLATVITFLNGYMNRKYEKNINAIIGKDLRKFDLGKGDAFVVFRIDKGNEVHDDDEDDEIELFAAGHYRNNKLFNSYLLKYDMSNFELENILKIKFMKEEFSELSGICEYLQSKRRYEELYLVTEEETIKLEGLKLKKTSNIITLKDVEDI